MLLEEEGLNEKLKPLKSKFIGIIGLENNLFDFFQIEGDNPMVRFKKLQLNNKTKILFKKYNLKEKDGNLKFEWDVKTISNFLTELDEIYPKGFNIDKEDSSDEVNNFKDLLYIVLYGDRNDDYEDDY